MRKCFWAILVILASAALSTVARAQTQSSGSSSVADDERSHPVLRDAWGRPVVDELKPGEKPGPAPYHDISGTWFPAESPGAGIQPGGAKDMPNDGKPEHQPPYTPLG